MALVFRRNKRLQFQQTGPVSLHELAPAHAAIYQCNVRFLNKFFDNRKHLLSERSALTAIFKFNTALTISLKKYSRYWIN